jgi:hypothetical protein
MTSKTGDHIQFWAQHHLARKYYRNHKLLTFDQFDSIDWKSIHRTLHDLPRLFQVWAMKHVLGIAATMTFLAHQDDRSPLCPSCLECNKSCKHVAQCHKVRRTLAFEQSVQGVKVWLNKNNTHPYLWSLLLWYLRGRGSIMCLEYLVALNLPHIIQEFAASQDVIGWDIFIMGMILSQLLPIQSAHFHNSNASSCATWWISGLITQLLQVIHTQWIYQCALVHDRTTGTLILAHKEELLKEIKHQLTLGPESFANEDRFLLECNFDELTSTTREHQEYWLLAIQAAREASHICYKNMDTKQQRIVNTGQRWA